MLWCGWLKVLAKKMEKRVGILTMGGDCSGLNSVIRGAYLRSKTLGYSLFGIKRGFRGLACGNDTAPDCIELTDTICDETMLTTSGSILLSDTKWMSSEVKNGRTVDSIRRAIVNGYKQLNFSGLICVGGDGSLKLLDELTANSDELKVVFVPKTIDNDVNYTDYAVGFQTSVTAATEAIENIRSTAKSHERTMVVEVMGRDAGFIALYAGIASGADVILVPEFKYDIEKVKNKVRENFQNGKNHCIIVVAESVEAEDFKHSEREVNGFVKYTHISYKGIGHYLAQKIKDAGFDCRSVTLGHIQRGGTTCIYDRLLGTLFGVEAINLVSYGTFGKMLAFSENGIKIIDIREVVKNVGRSLTRDDKYVKATEDLGVYIGEI